MKEWEYPYSPDQLRAAIQLKRMSCRQVARESGLNLSALCAWLKGRNIPKKGAYDKLVSFLQVELGKVGTTDVGRLETTTTKVARVVANHISLNIGPEEFVKIVRILDSATSLVNINVESFIIGCLWTLRFSGDKPSPT